MSSSRFPVLLASLLVSLPMASSPSAAGPTYAWRAAAAAPADTLEERIAPPPGFKRVEVGSGSWGAWLRGLPLKPADAPVLLYSGAPKLRQDVHVAVIDIDVGDRDLQQCADAIMRLRGEWLFAAGRKGDIGFNYTDGKRRAFASGPSGRRIDYAAFRKYMNLVFAYAGTYSLERELMPAPRADIAIGDVFIRGGFPGHAVLVADLVENAGTGEKRFLLIQSYMPAQEMHILRNPADSNGSPWYPAAFAGPLVTPEWTFPEDALRRWPAGPSLR